MSDLSLPSPGLFLGSVLFNSRDLEFSPLLQLWIDRFGPSLEFHHDFFPMKDYYSAQMGEAQFLKRVILISLTPHHREDLVTHKIWADELEKKKTKEKSYRALNLDIGLLTAENLTLATGKNFSHRIYLGHGVFSDLNLQIDHSGFKALPWTYPDYAHPDFIQFFNWARLYLLRKRV
jgi:hypothetical protein